MGYIWGNLKTDKMETSKQVVMKIGNKTLYGETYSPIEIPHENKKVIALKQSLKEAISKGIKNPAILVSESDYIDSFKTEIGVNVYKSKFIKPDEFCIFNGKDYL